MHVMHWHRAGNRAAVEKLARDNIERIVKAMRIRCFEVIHISPPSTFICYFIERSRGTRRRRRQSDSAVQGASTARMEKNRRRKPDPE